jgi:N-acetylmuramoyl-L-alanine amidase
MRRFYNLKITDMSKKIICIDAGHGGNDPGALGPNGLKESDVALSVAMLLGASLLTDFTVIYTRRDDRFVDLSRRATIANDAGADALISLHCNAGPPGQGEGFEVFTTPGQTQADQLATDVFLAWAEEFPLAVKRMDISDGDPDKEANFTVIRKSRMRAVLFELEFIHTFLGEQELKNPQWQARAARALAAGVRRHFQVPPHNPVTPLPAVDEDPRAAVKERLLELSAEMLTLHNLL